MLESAHAFFRSRSVRVFGVDVGPGSERDSVVERLIAHGFVPASRNAKLIRQGDLAPAARRDDLFEVVDR
jgi:S-adenosylmethionine hydrolase